MNTILKTRTLIQSKNWKMRLNKLWRVEK